MTNHTPRDSAQLPPLLPLPKVGPICHAMAADVQEYKVPRVGAHLVGVYDVALWSTDQLHAYAEAYAREALRAQAASVPVLYVSPIQLPLAINGTLEGFRDLEPDAGGYLPVRTKPGGIFTVPLYAGAPPAHVPADVEAMNAKQYQRILELKAALAEVLAFQSAPTTPTIHDYGRWRRLHDSFPAPQPQAPAASSPATAVDAVDDLTLLTNVHAQIRHLIDDLTTAVDDDGLTRYVTTYGGSLLYSNFIAALIPLAARLRAALQASRQPQAQQAVAEGAGEVAAWAVWWGLGVMRPLKTLFDTEDEAERNALCIKSYTEVRPVYATKEQRS